MKRLNAGALVALAVLVVSVSGCNRWGDARRVTKNEACRATGFHRVEKMQDGRWWAIDPDGRRYSPQGVVHVNLEGGGMPPTYRKQAIERYGSPEGWATNTLKRLKAWGFNTIDCDSDFHLLCTNGLAGKMGFGYAIALYMHEPMRVAGKKDRKYWITPYGQHCGMFFPNVFHPRFKELCEKFAAENCAPRKDDRDLFGYYIANELAWFGRSDDLRSGSGMFDYVEKNYGMDHPARQALERIVAECGGDRTNETTKVKFLETVAEKYFSVQTAAIRKYDSNHLILGCRFAGLNHPILFRVAGKYCDVVSFNGYAWADLARNQVRGKKFGRPVLEEWTEMYELAQKPLLCSEWSFVSMDRGHPCTSGAGQRFRTQKERAKAVELFLRTLYAMPGMLGTSYFKACDMPKEVADVGVYRENCAYGLVDANDVPYAEVTDVFTRLHREAQSLRMQPPPQEEFSAEDGTLSAHESLIRHGVKPGASFIREGDKYRVENGSGLYLEGTIGRGAIFDRIGIAGTNVVSLVGMVKISVDGGRNWMWPNANCVEKVWWRESKSAIVLRASWRGKAGEGWRGTFRITVPGEGNEALIEWLELENIGTQDFTVGLFYLRPYPFFKASKDRKMSPQNVYGALNEAWWKQPGEVRSSRLYSHSKDVDSFCYIFYAGDALPHPDGAFHVLGGRRVLKSGEKYAVQEDVYAWLTVDADITGK